MIDQHYRPVTHGFVLFRGGALLEGETRSQAAVSDTNLLLIKRANNQVTANFDQNVIFNYNKMKKSPHKEIGYTVTSPNTFLFIN